MEVVHEQFMPDPAMDRDEMKRMQRDIAATASFSNAHDLDVDDPAEYVVAGVDQAFVGDDLAISGIVVMRGEQVLERVAATTALTIPYIPGLLAFREGDPIIAAVRKLEREPDLFMFDGSGRIHFREAGIATHMGLLFDTPSIGVAKNLLCGTPAQSLDQPLQQHRRVQIAADEDVETCPAGTVLGHAYQSKQYTNTAHRSINPLYVSPGHRVGTGTATDLVAAHRGDHKLPRPVHRADRYVATQKPGD